MRQGDSQLSAYYAARAGEYERVYEKPERQADLARLKQLIPSYFVGRAVLEIACGTGYWTQFVAPVARKVTAIDINSETLAIARSKSLAAERVSFEVADVQHLPPHYKAFNGALALLLAPSFVTNFWQAVTGGNGRAILLRLWPFLVTATVTVWIGAEALTRVDLALLTALLGALLVTYAAVNLGGLRLTIPARHEGWAGPLVGSANGVLTGMTGSFVVPGVMFLQAIGLSRDMLIQAMGMLFTASTLALAAALQKANFLTMEHGILSFAAVIPAIVGMILGQRIRKRLSEPLFRKVFFMVLLVLGAYIMASALGTFR